MNYSHTNVSDKLNEFYRSSSIFIPNKFFVYIDGQYVTKAINNLKFLIDNGKVDINKFNFDKWLSEHVTTISITQNIRSEKELTSDFIADFGYETSVDTRNGTELADFGYENDGSVNNSIKTLTEKRVNFLWACQSVDIPLPTFSDDDIPTNRGMSLDPIRNIKYSAITDYITDNVVSLKVTEQKGMIWYHFFNELGNMFYDRQLLSPRDSLGKLTITIDAVINHDNDTTSIFELGPRFVFNDAVYSGSNNLQFSNSASSPMVHSVAFKVSNPFQQSFNHDTKTSSHDAGDDSCIINKRFNESKFTSNLPSETINYERMLSDSSRAKI